jgi:hypothetical protein
MTKMPGSRSILSQEAMWRSALYRDAAKVISTAAKCIGHGIARAAALDEAGDVTDPAGIDRIGVSVSLFPS